MGTVTKAMPTADDGRMVDQQARRVIDTQYSTRYRPVTDTDSGATIYHATGRYPRPWHSPLGKNRNT